MIHGMSLRRRVARYNRDLGERPNELCGSFLAVGGPEGRSDGGAHGITTCRCYKNGHCVIVPAVFAPSRHLEPAT